MHVSLSPPPNFRLLCQGGKERAPALGTLCFKQGQSRPESIQVWNAIIPTKVCKSGDFSLLGSSSCCYGGRGERERESPC